MNPNNQIVPISENHHNHKNQRLESPNCFIFNLITKQFNYLINQFTNHQLKVNMAWNLFMSLDNKSFNE